MSREWEGDQTVREPNNLVLWLQLALGNGEGFTSVLLCWLLAISKQSQVASTGDEAGMRYLMRYNENGY